MKKLDFKQPKYALPLIVLPFCFLLNYVYLDTFGTAEAKSLEIALQQTNDINPELPDANLNERNIQDKLGAAMEEHKYAVDYSAVRTLEEDEEVIGDYQSAYTAKEKSMLDSINIADLSMSSMPEADFMSKVQERQTLERNRYGASSSTTSSKPGRKQKTETAYEKEMRLFKEQMTFIDSLERAGEETPVAKKQKKKEAIKKEEKVAMPVSKSPNSTGSFFNTVKQNNEANFIKAILDEGLKVYAGGRIRIRLLEDIYVSDYEIEKGSYLYGIVSGFQAQRIEINITSVLYKNQIIPIDLTIYDNDGLSGLYIPDSQFRALAKELGADASSGEGMEIGGDPENTNQMILSMMDKMAQTTTKAVGSAIKQNKAKLKYNTVVYLIDNKAKIN